jgi:hypothetical protein
MREAFDGGTNKIGGSPSTNSKTRGIEGRAFDFDPRRRK